MKKARLILFQCIALVFTCACACASSGFVDDSGQSIEFSDPFKRIISLYAAHTENLFSLGLDREIVGVSTIDTYPPEALTKLKFSYRDDPERLIAVKPDLVLIRPMIFKGHGALVASLQAAGISVVSLQPNTVEEMFVYWRRLGALTGRSQKVEEMIERFSQNLREIQNRVARVSDSQRPRVYFESIHRKVRTFSPQSIAVFVLENAGGINIAQDARQVRDTNIAAYSKERILARANEIDIYLAQRGAMNKVSVDDIIRESGFKAIKAVREGKVFLVDEMFVSRPTMRLLVGLQIVQSLLYPGLKAQEISLGQDIRGAAE